MAGFYANITELKDNSAKLETQIKKYQDLSVKLSSIITKISDTWEGDSCETYVNMLRQYEGRLAGLIDVLGEYKKYIDDSVQIITETDHEIATRILNSFEGGMYDRA